MFGDVYHIGYLTDDMEAAKRFYQGVLDGELKKEIATPDGGKMAFMRVGATEVELIEPADKARLGGRAGLVLDHVGYVVADLDAAMRRLAERGVKFVGEPRINPEGARLIYMEADTTAGTRMHLTERPK